jgi:hypothetical protein
MGDASQTGNLKRSRFRSQVIIEGQPPATLNAEAQEEPVRTQVLYTHSTATQSDSQSPASRVTCHSLEELLSLLECDLVESLWFDGTVSPQERAYITGWARIFRPSVSAHLLQEKIAN